MIEVVWGDSKQNLGSAVWLSDRVHRPDVCCSADHCEMNECEEVYCTFFI